MPSESHYCFGAPGHLLTTVVSRKRSSDAEQHPAPRELEYRKLWRLQTLEEVLSTAFAEHKHRNYVKTRSPKLL